MLMITRSHLRFRLDLLQHNNTAQCRVVYKCVELIFFPNIKVFIAMIYCNVETFSTNADSRPDFRPATCLKQIFPIVPNKNWILYLKRFKPKNWSTCFDGVFQSSATADQDIIQSRRLVLQLPVVHLKQLVGIMEINHLRFPVERLHDVGQ